MRLPRTIGRYEFVELLGLGGGGAVYRARERGPLGLTHDVAVKVLSATHESLGGEAAFADEARVLSRIAHPCVVPIRSFEVLQDDTLGDLPVIVMPLVRGAKLSTVLRGLREQGALMPLPATLHLLLQLADALEAVHQATDEQGQPLALVHRDLKPANLMVSRQGDLLVLDFGIAWASQRSVVTAVGVIKGTLRTLSPEQLVGLRPDGRADLYAVGAIAFEMLVGEPFVAAEPGALTGEVFGALLETRLVHRLPALQRELAGAHGLTPAQAEHVTDLLVRLLQPDRERRFPHARALSAALESVASGQPVRRGRRWLAGVAQGQPLADSPWVPTPTRARLAPVEPPAPAAGPARAWLLPVVGLGLAVAGLALWVARGADVDRTPISLAGPVDELPIAAPSGPPLRIAHAPPLRTAGTGDRVFRAELSRAGECVPRMHMRAAAGGAWVARPMRGRSASFELRLSESDMAAFVGGVEYWIRCGPDADAPIAQWRSAETPGLLEW
jgi:serine/threonine protein kinase